jgi:DNA (cytosine-5)-methyltransferase 1
VESSRKRIDMWNAVASTRSSPGMALCAQHHMTAESPLPPGWEYTLPKAWVVTGGAPCQPYSRMGLRKGADDERDGIPAFLAAIVVLRPVVVMLEEVTNIMLFPEVVTRIVSTLEGLGYHVRKHVCDAMHYGTPQTRQRLVFVGSLLGPLSAPPWSVTKATTTGEALGMDAFRATSHPELHLSKEQEAIIVRFEELSRVKRTRDTTSDAPSRGVTASNTVGVTGSTLRLLLDDGVTRRSLTPQEVGKLQDFEPAAVDTAITATSVGQVKKAIGDAVPVRT